MGCFAIVWYPYCVCVRACVCIASANVMTMGPLHDPVTWYKIIYTGEQVTQWDFQNNATRTSSPGPAFVLKVPLRNLLTSIYNFVPCDRIVQRAHRDTVIV